MGCQKPVWRYAANCPARASRSIGLRSHTVQSPSISSMTLGDRTKKPPLIHPPSPCGFSRKLSTLLCSISNAPNRPGGWTAVQGCQCPLGFMKSDGSGNIHIAYSIAVGKAEIFISDKRCDSFQAPPGHRILARVDQGDIPRLGAVLVHFHAGYYACRRSHQRYAGNNWRNIP